MATPDLIAQADAERKRRAADADREVLTAGFRPRPAPVTSEAGSGFESGGVLDTSAPSAMLAGLTDAATRRGAARRSGLPPPRPVSSGGAERVRQRRSSRRAHPVRHDQGGRTCECNLAPPTVR